MKFLVINLGSTSTKISVFDEGKEVCKEDIGHDSKLLQTFYLPSQQFEMRLEAIEAYVDKKGIDLSDFTAIVSRGGNVMPFEPGAYLVDKDMLNVLADELSPHISNTSPRIAHALAEKYGLKAYVYDCVSCDELSEVARFSGMPFLPRVSLGHPLNQRAVARRYAQSVGRDYRDMNIIVVHMGGGCSVGMHEKGRIVDIMCDDEGGFTPERCGGVFCGILLEAYHRGQYSYDTLRRMWRGDGGLVAYLGTNSVIEVEARIDAGDEYSSLVFDAMVYQTAKTIGCMAGAYGGEVDAILLTGGVAHSKRWVSKITDKVGFIAPVTAIPGTYEMEALALGVERALKGEEPIHTVGATKGSVSNEK